MCYVQSLSHIQLLQPYGLACQAPLSMGILQARMLEWVAMPSSCMCYLASKFILVYVLPKRALTSKFKWSLFCHIKKKQYDTDSHEVGRLETLE